MLSNVLRIVAGGRNVDSASEATESLTTADASALVQTAPAPPQPPPRVGMVMDASEISWGILPIGDAPRFPYARPEFLFLTSEDEITISSDQTTRPILVPKDPQKMLMFAGYAETINSGKTLQNEDQACCKVLNITCKAASADQRNGARSAPLRRKKLSMEPLSASVTSSIATTTIIRRHSDEDLLSEINSSPVNSTNGNATSLSSKSSNALRAEGMYFAIFDGHAGTGAALMAANCLHEHIKERLSTVLEHILLLDKEEQNMARNDICSKHDNSHNMPTLGKKVTKDGLIIGALENAFIDMDEQIHEEKMLWRIPGGCATIVALFLFGKLYVANAGDCRAVLCCERRIEQLSNDFTPDYERKRLQFLAFRQPEMLNRSFSRLEYDRFLTRKDLRKKVLIRDWYMDGWCQKTVRESDLRPPMISDCHRKCRLLNTIGVTRGFGDHHLITVDENLPIKPFLTPVPEVKVFDLTSLDVLTDRDVLIIASDGLWDVISNEEAANIVNCTLSQNVGTDWTKYTLAAQDLVVAARGQPYHEGKRWRATDEGGKASTDDITVFVIPLKFALSATNDEDDVELLQ